MDGRLMRAERSWGSGPGDVVHSPPATTGEAVLLFGERYANAAETPALTCTSASD